MNQEVLSLVVPITLIALGIYGVWFKKLHSPRSLMGKPSIFQGKSVLYMSLLLMILGIILLVALIFEV